MGLIKWQIKKFFYSRHRFRRINNKKIVFSNFAGQGYSDNPKYIAQELKKRNAEYDLVWCVKDLASHDVPEGIRAVKYGTDECFYEWATAKAWVDNIRNTERPQKRRKQVYLQTWHGSYSPKKSEGASEDVLMPSYVRRAKKDGQQMDAIISGCLLESEVMKDYFWLGKKTEILEYGIPRNDILFNHEVGEKKREEIRRMFEIPENTGVILYMPTYRDDGSMDCYKLDFESIINAFELKFGRPFVAIVRLHPNIRTQWKELDYSAKVINGSLYPDSQELFFAADYLISDYSSAPFDFILLRRPAFLLSLDHESYCKTRGVWDEIEKYPFALSLSCDEFIEKINEFSMDEYWKAVDTYFGKYPMFDTGEAVDKVCDWIEQYLS